MKRFALVAASAVLLAIAIIQFLNAWESRGAIGQHHLANWPTKF